VAIEPLNVSESFRLIIMQPVMEYKYYCALRLSLMKMEKVLFSCTGICWHIITTVIRFGILFM
jgi:hypothetical protein